MPSACDVEVMTLKGGVTLPAGVIRLALKLEAAGCTLALDENQLIIRPARLVSENDRALVRQWRDDLVELVRYCENVTCQ